MKHNKQPLFTLTVLVMAMNAAYAADTTDLGTVGAQGQGAGSTVTSRAAAVAPAQASLQATQPQATISSNFFRVANSPVGDFSNITSLAPSVSGGMSANGPGLGESKNTLRGFKDGEYNVTWDGIPFGDTNGPTHHSTAYFPAAIIDSITVERGPGNASNLGQATFGGSLNMSSITPGNELAFSPYAAYGTWNTKLVGARLDTGAIGSAGESRLTINAQSQSSDGARTFSGIDGQNLMVKLDTAISSSTLLTVFMNYNKNYYYQPDKDNGLTMAQANTYGKNYSLSNDPTQANFYGYNRVEKDTTFNYIRLQSDLGNGWAIDNKAYYYHYMNTSLAADSGNKPGVGLANVKYPDASTTVAGQMPGYIKQNSHWVSGDILKATKETKEGLLRVGMWVEKAETRRALYDYNLLNMQPNFKEDAVGTTPRNISYDQNSGWTNYQPFAEFEWAAAKNLTVTPGVKFMSTRLNIDALVNATARVPQQITKDFNSTLPFLTANYKLDGNTSTYAQYAKGMLVPDISSYQSANANATNIDPQTSTNYQFGVVHKSNDITWDADIYLIDFNNKIAVDPSSSSTQPSYYNQGGVIYRGVEGQVTYALPNGLSLYANGSINSATTKDTNAQIALTPDRTAALALIYQTHGWTGVLTHKYTGDQYALDNVPYKINGYWMTNASLSYKVPEPGWGMKSLTMNVGVYNLFNEQNIIAVKTSSTTGAALSSDTYLFNPGTSVMFSIRGTF